MLSRASGRMKMWHSIFPEPDTCLLIASEIPSFVFTHLNPLSMKIIVSYTPEIDDKSESVSSIKVCCIHRALSFSKSFEDLFLHISCLHSLTVNLIGIPMWCRIKRSHCLLHQRHTARKQKKSLHWCSHWWSCLIPYLLSLSRDEWLARTWTSFHFCS